MVFVSQLLLFRFPFSFFLLPVFLIGLLGVAPIMEPKLGWAFIIWHFLVYPSSNAYNSLQDKDEGPIGGLKNPSKPHPFLFYVTLAFDFSAVMIAWLFVGSVFSGFVIIYILVSRAYSYRAIRLKKYPILGFFSVVLFQGLWVCISIYSIQFSLDILSVNHWILGTVASLLIGGVYPITQVYQHEADKNDGVYTISMLLGYSGTFIFSTICFGLAFLGLYFVFTIYKWLVIMAFQVPVLMYFLYWQAAVMQSRDQANFKHTMRMLILASFCMNLGLLLILILQTWSFPVL